MNDTLAIGCSPTADELFGPVVQGCRDGFDFTLTFEQYFFSIVPASILLIVAPLRVRYLSSLPNAVRGTSIRHIKLVAISLFAVTQLILVVLWATRSNWGVLRSASIASSSLSFVVSLIACALSYTEHAKSLSPSAILNAYLLISLLLDGATLRTTWLSPLPTSIRAVFTTSFTLKAAILLLEAKEKRGYILNESHQHSPEDTSGLYSRGLFWWLNPLLLVGFRHLLKPSDLFPVADGMSATVLNEKFWNTWNSVSQEHNHKLVGVCVKTLKWQLLAAVPPRLILVAFTICQPLLISRFLSYLQNENESVNIGYGLIGAYGLVYVGMAISSGFYSHKAYRMATMLRTVLVAAIFKKTTNISITATDNSASVTLMSTDVDAIVRSVRDIHDLWANIAQIGISTWLLTVFIGPAAAAPIVVCIISLGLTVYISPNARVSQRAWFGKVQKRVGITSKMLGHMKSIKMSGLARKLVASISQMRMDEISAARPFRLIMCATSAIAQVPVSISPVAAFAIFAIVAVRTGQTFEAARLFSSLSLILLLAAPLFGTCETILGLQSSLACFDRIQKFLSTESRVDPRIRTPVRQVSQADSSRYEQSPASSGALDYEVELLNTSKSTQPAEQDLVTVTDIHMHDSSFAWSADARLAVTKVSLRVTRGQFLVLVGPVASGKSTLLRGLLGEVPVTSGAVTIARARMSWCDQTPWLKNETVRNNILGYNNFDSNLYKQVVYACDLQKDFSQFPNGDETLVGSKGISLSGGQKQRVALARAVYSKPQIALFDDILSGLDNHTSNLVCTRLFNKREGILRKWGTTIVLATQSVSPLSIADQILVLGKDGIVTESGSCTELLGRDGYVRSIWKTEKRAVEDHPDEAAQEEEEESRFSPKQDKTDPTDKRRQSGDSTVYRYYFSSMGITFSIILFGLQASSAFLQTFPSVWLKWWSDASAAEGNQSIGLYLGVYTAFQVGAVAVFFISTWFVLVKVVAKSGLELHERLLRAVVRAPLSLFTTDDTGSITTRFSQDIGEVDRNLPLGMLVTIGNCLTCIGQAVLMASATWYMAICYPFLIGVFFSLQKAYLRTSRQLRFLDLEQKAPVYTQFIETLAGLSTIRAFGWEEPAVNMNHELIDRSQKPFYLLLMIQRWLTLVLDFIVAALALLVVGLAVKLRDSVSIGLTGVALVQLITFTENVRMLILWWTSLETSIGAIARIKQFSENTQDENQPGENQPVPGEWPARGEIDLQGLSASYGEKDEIKALDGISISVKPGEKVGIVGRTGSGKSSLLLSIVRMLDLSAGSIIIDGLDISTLPREEVRSRLIAITQDQFFLPGSIRQNIDPYEASTSDEITAVLTKIGLWEPIELKGGLDTDFEEVMLSHGQRQLFFLARAILRKKCGNVVLLDEATSSVDQHTESRVQQLIRDEFRGHTVIAIAHRLETIAEFDRVVVLEKGCVVDQGNPVDLLQRNGPFKSLWDAAHVTEN